MTALYQIAGKRIRICSLHDDVRPLCHDYRSGGTDDFAVTIAQTDIDNERAHAASADFSDGYLETLAVYRKIALAMLDHDTLLFHGSCVAVDGIGYLFTARNKSSAIPFSLNKYSHF